MPTYDPKFQAGAEGPRGMRSWPGDVARWLFGRAPHPREHAEELANTPRFRNVCISREAGAGGAALARTVAARLGWRLYDRELLDAIAQRMELPVDEVKVFDELAPSVVQDWILPLREEHYAPQEAYLDHLAKLIEAIGRAGKSVIVGRGACFHLPRDEALSVRVVAPLKVRAVRLAERMGVSVRTARRAARDLDRRRKHFVRTMYRADDADPHHYDVVLNTEALGLAIAAELVIKAVEEGEPKPDAQPRLTVEDDAAPEVA
jgi:cytidylate kinase